MEEEGGNTLTPPPESIDTGVIMVGIFDPWHSRPIDVHRWSDHPQVAGLVEQLWETHFQVEEERA